MFLRRPSVEREEIDPEKDAALIAMALAEENSEDDDPYAGMDMFAKMAAKAKAREAESRGESAPAPAPVEDDDPYAGMDMFAKMAAKAKAREAESRGEAQPVAQAPAPVCGSCTVVCCTSLSLLRNMLRDHIAV